MKKYITEYVVEGEEFCGEVDAIDWPHAQAIADMKRPPQEVIGVVFAIVYAAHWTASHANAFVRAMALQPQDMEPPDASEFE